MANPTLAALRTAVRESHHQLSSSNGIPDKHIDTGINNAIEDICNLLFQYNEFNIFGEANLSIVADVGTIDLPADFDTLRKITKGANDGYVRLADSLDELIIDTGTNSINPDGYFNYRVWFPNRSEMWYRPISTANVANAFKIYYGKGCGADLAADGTEMVLDSTWKRLVVLAARAYIFTSENEPNDYLWAEYQRLLEGRLNVIRQPITKER